MMRSLIITSIVRSHLLCSIDVKAHLEFIKNAIGASNPQVRTSAVSLLGVMYLYLKAQLRVFFEDEKPTVLQLIDAQFEKVCAVRCVLCDVSCVL